MISRSVVRSVLLAVATMLVANIGYAAIIGTATLVKDPTGAPPTLFTSPDTALNAAVAPSWVSYKLTLTATAGETIQAVQAVISGQLHQHWIDADGDGDVTPADASGQSANATNGDSHLLAPAGSLFGSGPTEDNPGTGSPLSITNDSTSGVYGKGTQLSGAWSLVGANVGSTANIAYIVVPKGSAPTLQMSVLVANPQGQTIGNLTAKDFFVPEPASIALASIGLIGLVGLVRRRS